MTQLLSSFVSISENSVLLDHVAKGNLTASKVVKRTSVKTLSRRT